MPNKKLIEMSALGRSFSLGSLYNYVDDSVLPNFRLWDDEDMSKVTKSAEMDEIDVCVETGDIFEETTTRPSLIKFDIDHHSVASLMAGLVEESSKGAWRYVANRLEWSVDPVARRADAVVYCRRSVKKKLLPDAHLEKLEVIYQSKKLVENKITHVVVAITYGAEAFCLFSNTGGSNRPEQFQSVSERDAAASTKATKRTLDYAHHFAKSLTDSKSQLIPFIQDDEGDKEDGGQSLTDIDVHCTLYSNLIEPNRMTSSIAEQFDICKRMMHQPLKKSTPLKVWLYPLRRLTSIDICKKLADPKDVSRELTIKIAAAWNRLVRIRNVLDSFTDGSTAIDFNLHLNTHRQNVNDLCGSVDDFARHFRAFLSRCVIGIRQGGMSDAILAESLEAIESRPELDPALVTSWLIHQNAQTRFLVKLSTLPGVVLMRGTKQLDRSLKQLVAGKFAVILYLPSLTGRSNKLVSEMALFVNSFNPLEERPFKMTTPTANNAATLARLDEKLLFGAAQNFSSWVVENNQQIKNVQYIIHYDEDDAFRERSPFTRLYWRNSGGSLYSTNFEIPQAPGGVNVEENNRGVLTISWDVVGNANLSGYLVQYCSIDNGCLSERWESCDNQVSNRITLRHLLHPEAKYVFRVATLTPGGRSPFRRLSLPIAVDPICRPPENLQCEYVSDTSLHVNWVYEDSFNQVRPFGGDVDDRSSLASFVNDIRLSERNQLTVKSFMVEYWIENLQQSMCMQRFTQNTHFVLEPLSAGTAYCVQVRAECEDSSGSKHFSPPSSLLRIETLSEPERLALRVRRESKERSARNIDGMPIYQVPLNKQPRSISSTGRVGRYSFGEPNYAALFGSRRQRTILVLGATGSGKSTLINAMINYILGVEWDDDFRFKLIDEGSAKSQAHSQTDLISTYDLYETRGFRLNHSLTVVDTPGFGDTQGVEADKKITQQIRDYFQRPHGVVQLEAVCFVVQSGLGRLTETQKYIFDSVLSVFGRDIKDNIRLMVTFADNAQPPVLEAVVEAGIPTPVDPQTGLPVHQKFNNSIFFEGKKNVEETDEFNKNYFDLAVKSFDAFFDDLSRMEAKSLTLTRRVLEERKQLEALVERLVFKTEYKLTKNDEMQQVLTLLKENKEQMEVNKETEFEIEVLVPKSIDISRTGQFTTNCDKCKTTCHFPCQQSSDENKHKCSIMDENGSCKACNCHWSVHFNQKYRFEMVKEKKKLSSDAILAQYLGAKSKAASHEEKVKAIQKQMDINEKEVNKLIADTLPRINRLNEIALKPHAPSSVIDYIDMMIKNENQEHQPGYQQRVASLQNVRKQAEMSALLVQNHRLRR